MPVRIDEFESGALPDGPSVPEQAVSYLYTNRDHAFTRSEIASGIDESPNAVGTALSRLKDRNLVRHRGGYWAITDDEERLADAYDLHTASERARVGRRRQLGAAGTRRYRPEFRPIQARRRETTAVADRQHGFTPVRRRAAHRRRRFDQGVRRLDPTRNEDFVAWQGRVEAEFVERVVGKVEAYLR